MRNPKKEIPLINGVKLKDVRFGDLNDFKKYIKSEYGYTKLTLIKTKKTFGTSKIYKTNTGDILEVWKIDEYYSLPLWRLTECNGESFTFIFTYPRWN